MATEEPYLANYEWLRVAIFVLLVGEASTGSADLYCLC